MRYIIFFFIVFLFCPLSAQNAYQKKFQVESGQVEYNLTGSLTGKKTLWFDHYGDAYFEETNTEEKVKTLRGTEIVKSHSLMIFDGIYYYNINMATMEGTKMHKNAVPDFSILGSGLNDQEMEQLGESFAAAFGGKVEKKSETVMGRTCDVTTMMGATVHVYKGVVLRSDTKIGSQINIEEAVLFDENITIPGSKFTPPKNAKIEDVSADMMSDYAYDEEEEEQGLLFPSGITFEQYKKETERVRRDLGYLFAMHDASGGQYSSICTKAENNMLAFGMFSLQNYADWQNMYEETGMKSFILNGKKAGYVVYSEQDEDTGKTTNSSSLFIELKNKDALLQLTSVPVISKEELIKIFNQLNF